MEQAWINLTNGGMPGIHKRVIKYHEEGQQGVLFAQLEKPPLKNRLHAQRKTDSVCKLSVPIPQNPQNLFKDMFLQG